MSQTRERYNFLQEPSQQALMAAHFCDIQEVHYYYDEAEHKLQYRRWGNDHGPVIKAYAIQFSEAVAGDVDDKVFEHCLLHHIGTYQSLSTGYWALCAVTMAAVFAPIFVCSLAFHLPGWIALAFIAAVTTGAYFSGLADIASKGCEDKKMAISTFSAAILGACVVSAIAAFAPPLLGTALAALLIGLTLLLTAPIVCAVYAHATDLPSAFINYDAVALSYNADNADALDSEDESSGIALESI